MHLNVISFEAKNWEFIQNLKYFWTLLYTRRSELSVSTQ